MTHQITGVGCAAVTAAALNTSAPATAVLLGSAWLGSLLPDADRAGARVYTRTRIERRVFALRPLGTLLRLPLRVLSLLPHRGPTHSLFGCALTAAIGVALASLLAPAFVAF